MGMDEGTVSHLMSRFYALGQLSAQMQGVVEEIDYLIEENAGPSLQALRELGATLNQILEGEADKLIGLQDTTNMINTLVVSIEHMADRRSVQLVMGAVAKYNEHISGYKQEVETLQEEQIALEEEQRALRDSKIIT